MASAGGALVPAAQVAALSGDAARAAAGFTGVVPPSPGFTGVVPPPGFSGIVPSGNQPWTGPNLSPLLVKEAVINLRQAFVAQGGKIIGVKPSDKDEEKEKESEVEPENFFTVLELKRGAAEDAIKKSYRKLVLLWHPDKHPTDREEAEEKIRKINSAYETLGNPVKREGYLQMLDAIERKKKNLKLDTSFIQPRMSIPKEFMLCPLGHPDKFVRAVNNEFVVQSRDEVRLPFAEFFSKAKFTLWWTPEVNNMCRFRTAESAGQGQEGGMFLNFTMDGAPTVGGQVCIKDADCVLRANEDPRYSNLIAVASPFSPGAFRFEGAFWPGHYLSFRAPGKFCMAGLVDEVKDITDFYLVDYTAAYKTMTVDEALLGPVMSHGNGDWVKLSDLRADLGVRNYFQGMLKSPVWNNREFEDFFEGHFEQWEFDKKRASVRPRSAAQQLEEKLRRATKREDVAKAIMKAGEELGQLPVQAVHHWLQRLVEGDPPAEVGAAGVQAPTWQVPHKGAGQKGFQGKGFGKAAFSGKFGMPPPLGKGFVPPPPPGAVVITDPERLQTTSKSPPPPQPPALLAKPAGPPPAGVLAAIRRLLSAMAAVCTAAPNARSGETATLDQILALKRTVCSCDFEAEDKGATKETSANGEAEQQAKEKAKEEEPLSKLIASAVQALAGLVSERLAKGGEKLDAEMLKQVLELPLTWKSCVEKLGEIATPILEEPKPPGSFLDLLHLVRKAGKDADPLAEAIARRELQALALAQGDIASEILLALVDGGILLKDVCASLKAPVLDRLPLPELVRMVSALGVARPDDENLRPALETRIKPPINGLSLAKVPAADLLGLARASQKSPMVEELVLDAVASAASLALKNWTPKDAMDLALLLASSKDCRDNVGSQEVYVQTAEVVSGKGTSLKSAELLEAVLDIGKLEKAKDLLKVVAAELSEHLADIEQAQLLPLTEIFITLGAESEALSKLLAYWATVLGDKEKTPVRVDQVARLTEMLAAVVPNNEAFFQAAGKYVETNVRQLSNTGRTALANAFVSGAGPDFPGKASLLSTLESTSKRPRSRDRGRGGAADSANNNHGERERERPREQPKAVASGRAPDGREGRRDRGRDDRDRGRDDRQQGREDRDRGRDRGRERHREERDRGRDDRDRDRDRGRGRERGHEETRKEEPRKRDRDDRGTVGRKGGMRAFSDDEDEVPERGRKRARH